MAAEAEREAKSMRPASGLVLVPVSMSALAVPAVLMVPVAVAVLEQPVQPICLRRRFPACAIRGS